MKLDLGDLLWLASESREGLEALAVETNLPIRDVVLPPVEPRPEWMENACALLGLELESAVGTMPELGGALSVVSPGIIIFFQDMRILFVTSSARGRVRLLSSSLKRVELEVDELTAALRARYEKPPFCPPHLEALGVSAEAYARVAGADTGDRRPSFGVSSIRVGTTQSLRDELRFTAFGSRLVLAGVLLVLQSALAIGATVWLGQQAGQGRIDAARILGWGLAVATQALLQGVLGLVVGRLNIDLATSLKRRLVDGALSLEPDFVRQAGVGANLSTAAESATVDQLSVSDVAEAVSTFLVFVTSFAFLLVEDWLSGLALAGIAVATGYLTYRYFQVSTRLTALRIKLTDIFVERILGHQTRLVQLPRSRWHEGEDEHLHAYVEEAMHLDSLQTALAVIPRVWLVLLALLQVRFLFAGGQRYLVAVPLVAGYAAMQALSQLNLALQRLVRWPVSLRVLLPILARATRVGELFGTRLAEDEVADGDVLVEASGIRFGYHPMRPPVLNGLNLTIRAGDHLLVTGPSGGGKSTLAAVLTALRQPSAGLVMLRGLDQHSVSGSEWRRKVVSAPQFHENYVFQNTFAFNLLMGRAWPPTPPDLAEAEQLCHELGLGPLLESMPAGLQQVVGETGWRLSHGERSRVFIARALLQNADVLILDESFGALDPETLDLAMNAVRQRARTLVVISHK